MSLLTRLLLVDVSRYVRARFVPTILQRAGHNLPMVQVVLLCFAMRGAIWFGSYGHSAVLIVPRQSSDVGHMLVPLHG